MPSSVTSIFSEPDDYCAALRKDGVLNVVATRGGIFRARLTQIVLHRLRLTAGEEELPRIAFVTVPAGMMMVALPVGGKPSPVWGGIELRTGEIITLGEGQCAHVRIDGLCRWATLLVPSEDIVQYAASLSEGVLDIPSAARWRPKSAVSRQFRQLCLAAIRVAESRSKAVIDNQAAHGLEQQLLDALGRCLVGAPDFRETSVNHRDRVTLGRFDELLQSEAARETADLSAALGVSERKLRTCCRKHLGVNPSTYIRLLQMQLRQRLPEGFAGHV